MVGLWIRTWFWAEGEKPEEDEQVLPAGLALLCRWAQNWALSPADSILTLTISHSGRWCWPCHTTRRCQATRTTLSTP